MKKVTIKQTREKVINAITQAILGRIDKYGAWVDWYNGDETRSELDSISYDTTEIGAYNDGNEDADFWEDLDDMYGEDEYALYVLALDQAYNRIKYIIAITEDTNEKCISLSNPSDGWQTPKSYWYGNNKKKLVNEAYNDNWVYGENEHPAYTKTELYDMIEEIDKLD